MCRIGGKCAAFRAKTVEVSGHLPVLLERVLQITETAWRGVSARFRKPDVIDWRDEYQLSKQSFRCRMGEPPTPSASPVQTWQTANPFFASHLRRDFLRSAHRLPVALL